MLLKTHLAINFFLALFFSSYIQYKILFVLIILAATALPDIDTTSSYISKKAKFLSRLVNFFSKHRGFFHSFTCSLILSIFLLFLSPKIALPFFIGYSLHVLADSFTIEGTEIFWPLKKRLKGRIRTNGITEKIIFVVFIIMDIVYLAYLLKNIL